MKRWMTVAMLAVAATLAVAVVDPTPARADTTEDVLIWSAVGVGVGIVIVLVATYFSRDEDQIFLTEPPRHPRDGEDRRVHFGTECIKPDGTAALLCW